MRRPSQTLAIMIYIAWALALLAAANARTYGRCELARELQRLGMHENLSTWVCIAYHESRYKTNAYGSTGDHGIFQISELFWCGSGKACGVSCEAMRDDNIADDVQCARQVHQEHTRLQGDGFLAWVVYPQHCTGNTWQWLDQCNLRNGYGRSFIDTDVNKPNDVNVLPSYLGINSIFQNYYGKEIANSKGFGTDWYNYKLNEVDELEVPVREQKPASTTTRTTTSTTSQTPPLTSQFIQADRSRNESASSDKITDTSKSITKQDYAFQKITVTEPTTHKSKAMTPGVSSKVKSTTSSYKSTATTIKPVDITNTAYKLPVITASSIPTTSPAPAATRTRWWPRSTMTTTNKPKYSFLRSNRAPETAVKPQVSSDPTSTLVTKSPLASMQKTKTTQSIWDLYLRPTKAPKYQPFDFSKGFSKFKLNIFSSGTTIAPSKQNT